ncbi:MAG TPA: DEAD/DEAH box helicase, partial [Dehalococcoidia bacterium]|nr:DEAD/DEAH box helicase [Dehalococcoidia bacterium]
MALAEALEQIRHDPELGPNFVEWRELPAVPACRAPLPGSLDPRIVDALRHRGIDSLYSHQAQAIEAVLAGRNVAVVTPTASGKTLCYNVPVLNAILADPEARAIYLFPTKALAQDQLDELHGLITAVGADVR